MPSDLFSGELENKKLLSIEVRPTALITPLLTLILDLDPCLPRLLPGEVHVSK